MKKNCFIITPIGSETSLVRNRVDQWMKMIYEPVFKDDFEIIRADRISSPGLITKQILELVINAELVIIDYTDLNPNVMYEAAIRHIARKPYIQISPHTQRLPFDIHNLRVIQYDPNNLEYPKKLVDDLSNSYKIIKDPNFKVDEILPYEFDLNKTISDPEKLVELFQKVLKPVGNNRLIENQETISEIYDTSVINAGTAINVKRIKCPKCGILKDFYKDPYSLSSIMEYMPKHYKCNNCGAEFEIT